MKKFFSVLLALCLMVGCLPMAALATGTETPAAGTAVAKIGETTYTDLKAAIEAVPTDGTATTIQLLADVTLNPATKAEGFKSKANNNYAALRVSGGRNVVLDLNGHVLDNQSTTVSYTISVGSDATSTGKDNAGGDSNLTIIDTLGGGKMTNSNPASSTIDVDYYGTLTVGSETAANNNFTIANNEKTIKENSTIKTEEGSSKLIVLGGTIDAPTNTDGKGRSVQCLGTAEIKGGTILHDFQVWSYTGYEVGNVTISGGVLEKNVLVVSTTSGTSNWPLSGQVTITGGEVKGKAGIQAATEDQKTGSTAKVTVTGGKVGSVSKDAGEIEITGGEFSADPSEYVAETHTATNTGSCWVITEKVDVTTSNGNAAATVAPENIAVVEGESGSSTTITAITGSADAAKTTVTVGKEVVSALTEEGGEQKVDSATIETDAANVTLPAPALEAMKDDSNDVEIVVEKKAAGDIATTEVAADAIKAAVDITVKVNGQEVLSADKAPAGLADKPITITVKTNVSAGTEVHILWKNGDAFERITRTAIPVPADGIVPFTVPHLSTYAVVAKADGEEIPVSGSPEPTPTPTTAFEDVPEGAYYKAAVDWAVTNNTVFGITDTIFGPDMVCTRAQAVSFLWRAAGREMPTAATNPFADVADDAYYKNAVLWAVEKGITFGTSDTTFSPDAPCTRAQIVSFLYRYAGKPEVTTGSTFTDVPADAYYAAAVNWAVAQGVTFGMGDGTFAPNRGCTRGQTVSFLWRAVGRPE